MPNIKHPPIDWTPSVAKKCLQPNALSDSANPTRYHDCKSAMLALQEAIKNHTGTFDDFQFEATLTTELQKFSEEGAKICEDEFAKLQGRKA